MKSRLIKIMLKEYSDYEIDEAILSNLYNKMIKGINVKKDRIIEIDLYFIFKKYIDNYIFNEIKNGNKDYEIYLLLKTEYIVNRYYNIKKDSKKINHLADVVLEDCLNTYNKDENYNKQVVKQIRKNLKS